MTARAARADSVQDRRGGGGGGAGLVGREHRGLRPAGSGVRVSSGSGARRTCEACSLQHRQQWSKVSQPGAAVVLVEGLEDCVVLLAQRYVDDSDNSDGDDNNK